MTNYFSSIKNLTSIDVAAVEKLAEKAAMEIRRAVQQNELEKKSKDAKLKIIRKKEMASAVKKKEVLKSRTTSSPQPLAMSSPKTFVPMTQEVKPASEEEVSDSDSD